MIHRGREEEERPDWWPEDIEFGSGDFLMNRYKANDAWRGVGIRLIDAFLADIGRTPADLFAADPPVPAVQVQPELPAVQDEEDRPPSREGRPHTPEAAAVPSPRLSPSSLAAVRARSRSPLRDSSSSPVFRVFRCNPHPIQYSSSDDTSVPESVVDGSPDRSVYSVLVFDTVSNDGSDQESQSSSVVPDTPPVRSVSQERNDEDVGTVEAPMPIRHIVPGTEMVNVDVAVESVPVSVTVSAPTTRNKRRHDSGGKQPMPRDKRPRLDSESESESESPRRDTAANMEQPDSDFQMPQQLATQRSVLGVRSSELARPPIRGGRAQEARQRPDTPAVSRQAAAAPLTPPTHPPVQIYHTPPFLRRAYNTTTSAIDRLLARIRYRFSRSPAVTPGTVSSFGSPGEIGEPQFYSTPEEREPSM